jgi:hypothetical protein
MTVDWDPLAFSDWLKLSVEDATAVARAVERWAEIGEGIVYAAEGGEFRLFVGAHVVLSPARKDAQLFAGE